MAASKFGQFAGNDMSASSDGIVNQSPTGQYGGPSPSASSFAAVGPNPEWGNPMGTPTTSQSGGGVLPTSVAGSYGGGGGGPDGRGVGGTDSGMALADGGAIPDDGDTNTNQPVDIGAALNMVQNALAFGRQKYGLPTQLTNSAKSGSIGGSGGAALDPPDTDNAQQGFSQSGTSTGMTPVAMGEYAGGGQVDAPVKKPPGMSPATYAGQPTLPMGPQTGLPKWIKKNEDDGDEDDTDTQHFADGGAVEDDSDNDSDANSQGVIPPEGGQAPAPEPQGAPQGAQGQPQDPKRLVSYAMGADGVTPDVAAAMEARIDPQGQMDPSERKLLAIAAARDPQQAWALMQHYRQKFNAYTAFAKAAAQGSQQRPANLQASTQAATQAYANLPDGNSMTFQPTRGGVAVTMKKLGGAAPKQQNFAGGGDVGDDDPGQDDPAQQGVIPPESDTPAAPPPAHDASVSAGLGRIKNFVLSIPQYLGLTDPANYEKALTKGTDAVLNDASQNTPQSGTQTPDQMTPISNRTSPGIQAGGRQDPEAGYIPPGGRALRRRAPVDPLSNTDPSSIPRGAPLAPLPVSPGAAQARAATDLEDRKQAGRLQLEKGKAITGGTDPALAQKAFSPGAASPSAAPSQQGGPQPPPAAAQRQVGTVYMTPKGPAKWMGQGWQRVQ